MHLPGELAKLAELVNDIQEQGPLASKKLLRPLAGLTTWISSVLPQFGPFSRMLWAAINTDSNHETIFYKQVAVP